MRQSIRRFFVLILVAATIVCSTGLAQRQSATAMVTIQVVDGMGSPLSGAKITSFKRLGAGPDFGSNLQSKPYRSNELEAIPYGTYQVKISVEGYPDIEQTIRVFQPRLVLNTRTATVHLVPVSGLGGGLAGEGLRVQSFRDPEGLYDLTDRFQKNVGTKIPYGEYELEANYSPERLHIDVFQPDVYVLVNEEFSIVDTRGIWPSILFVKGTVNNIPPGTEPVFVKLVGVFTNYLADAKVDMSGQSGNFSISGNIPVGKYVLVTTAGEKTLDVREIALSKVPPPSPIIINLGTTSAKAQ